MSNLVSPDGIIRSVVAVPPTSQSGPVTTTIHIPATDGIFLIGFGLKITSNTSNRHISINVDYTDENSISQDIVMADIYSQFVFITETTFWFSPAQFFAKAGTNIDVAVTVTSSGTISYNLSYNLIRLS